MVTASFMLAARLMKSNMKLKMTSECGLASSSARVRRGIRHPFDHEEEGERIRRYIFQNRGEDAQKIVIVGFDRHIGVKRLNASELLVGGRVVFDEKSRIRTSRCFSFQDPLARRNAFRAIPKDVSSNFSFALCQGPAKPFTYTMCG